MGHLDKEGWCLEAADLFKVVSDRYVYKGVIYLKEEAIILWYLRVSCRSQLFQMLTLLQTFIV